MAARKPFYLLDPAILSVASEIAATSGGAADAAPLVGADEMRPVDVVVCGSVAVNRQGARIGKGTGYSDIELALPAQAGLIGADTSIVTTVHPLQAAVPGSASNVVRLPLPTCKSPGEAGGGPTGPQPTGPVVR